MTTPKREAAGRLETAKGAAIRRDRVGQPWSAEERDMLRDLAQADFTGHRISLLLGRSRSAVQQKAIEMGLTLRPSSPAPRARASACGAPMRKSASPPEMSE
jgi:hypothetical protein